MNIARIFHHPGRSFVIIKINWSTKNNVKLADLILHINFVVEQIMSGIFRSFITAVVAITVASGALAQTDTLLVASTAKKITVASSLPKISITVKNIDGSSDNFFYETSAVSIRNENVFNMVAVNDISNISVVECNDSIMVGFIDRNGVECSYSYRIPDPENREVRTWTGAKGSDFGINLAKTGSTRYDIVTQGFGFGWIGSLGTPAGMNPSMWHSHEYTWHMIGGLRISRNYHSLNVGLGMRFRDIETKGPEHFWKNEEGRIEMRPYEVESRRHSSRIDLFNLQIPVTYGLKFGHRRRWFLEAGPVVNFNTGASIKTEYTIGSRDYSVKTRGIHQNPITVDLFGAIGFREFGLYVRYAPMKVLRSSAALDFSTISTGIMLVF